MPERNEKSDLLNILSGILEELKKLTTPDAIFRPDIQSEYGNWYAHSSHSSGESLMGMGETPEKAIEDFNKHYYEG